MAVPIVATPGGVVSAFSQGSQTGLDLGSAILANKRISPELANLLQHTYNTINKNAGTMPPDASGGQDGAPSPDVGTYGQDPGQAPAGPGQQALAPVQGPPAGPLAPTGASQMQAPMQGPPAPTQGQAQQSGMQGFLQHFHDRLMSGKEDPAMLGKEAALAKAGHLPNHPAMVGMSPPQSQAQNSPTGTYGQSDDNAPNINFSNLSNRDLMTARAMMGDLASYQGKRSVAQTRKDIAGENNDTKKTIAGNNETGRNARASAETTRKTGQGDARLAEKTKNDQEKADIARRSNDIKESTAKAREAAKRLGSTKSFDPRTEEGKNARTDLATVAAHYNKLMADKHLLGESSGITDSDIADAKKQYDNARARIQQGAPGSAGNLGAITSSVTSGPTATGRTKTTKDGKTYMEMSDGTAQEVK